MVYKNLINMGKHIEKQLSIKNGKIIRYYREWHRPAQVVSTGA